MITLKPFQEEDFARLCSWIHSERELFEFAGSVFTFPLTPDQLSMHLLEFNRFSYKVILQKENTVIGHCELNINNNNSSGRICRVIIGDNHYRGKGFGKMIIEELKRIAFVNLKLHRLDLGVFDFNTNAINCYLKCGFQIEGLLKDSCKFNDNYWSTYNMAIISPFSH